MTIFSGKKLSWDLPPPAPTHSFVSCPVGLGWSQGGGVCERLLASFSVWFPRFGVPLLLGDLFDLGSGMADPRISGSPRPIASGLADPRISAADRFRSAAEADLSQEPAGAGLLFSASI